MSKSNILVIGSSGMVGSNLVQVMRRNGHSVRETTSRKDNANGSDRVFLNLVTGENVHAAFEGIERAFLLSPPGYADQYSMLSPLIQEAKRRGLKKVVLMTAMGANAVETAPFRRAELELETSGLNYNIIRPNWFLQNFNSFWVHGIKQENQIALPAGQAKVSFIDARDISEVAAALLTKDKWNNKDFDLTGPVAVDHHEVAESISTVTGRLITYKDIAPDVLKSGLVGAGLPVDYVDFMIMIFGFLREGYNERTTNAVKEILGRDGHSLADYVKANRSAW
jgi:uncharacterized protein YbjT (DUF2867 family)